MRPYNQTVVGCYEDPGEGDFIEHVKARSPEGAVRMAVSIDPARRVARIIAVFIGHQHDFLPSEAGVSQYGGDFDL